MSGRSARIVAAGLVLLGCAGTAACSGGPATPVDLPNGKEEPTGGGNEPSGGGQEPSGSGGYESPGSSTPGCLACTTYTCVGGGGVIIGDAAIPPSETIVLTPLLDGSGACENATGQFFLCGGAFTSAELGGESIGSWTASAGGGFTITSGTIQFTCTP